MNKKILWILIVIVLMISISLLLFFLGELYGKQIAFAAFNETCIPKINLG